MEWSKIKEGIGYKKFLRLRMMLFWSSVILLVFFAINGWVEGLLSSILFLYCVLIFNSAYSRQKIILGLDRGEMRRSIAIILTIAFISVLFLDLSGNVRTSDFTLYFAYGVYGVVISFYFGSRSVEMKDKKELIKKGDVGKILEISYAVGDISKKEYDQKKDELGLKCI